MNQPSSPLVAPRFLRRRFVRRIIESLREKSMGLCPLPKRVLRRVVGRLLHSYATDKSFIERWAGRGMRTAAMCSLLAGVIPEAQADSAGSFPVYLAATGACNPLNTVDVGSASAPRFVDINGDGLLDAVVGALDGTLRYYQNGGSTTRPSLSPFTGGSNPFNGIDIGSYSTPTFVDIDGDGDFDLFVGSNTGYSSIRMWKNNGTADIPSFSEMVGEPNPLNGIFAPFAVVAFVDIDGDGDKDAFIGRQDGTILFYRNTGNASSAVFSQVTGAGNPFNSFNATVILPTEKYSAPAFVDIDGDGDFDALVGSQTGQIRFLENTSNASSPVFVERTGASNPFNGIDIGVASSPTFANLDGDSDMDLFMGGFDGLTYVFRAGGGAPVIAAVNTLAGSYSEGGAGVPPFGSSGAISLGDCDSVNLAGAAFTIVNFQTGDLLNFANQNGISGSYNAGSGVLTLSGSASVANYQTAIRSVTYTFSGDDPTIGGTVSLRSVHLDVTDDTAQVGTTSNHQVSVSAVNDSPTVNASNLTVLEDTATALTGITFGDPDAGAGSVTATISVDSGTLTPGLGAGVTVGGTASSRTVSGTITAINNYLSGGGLLFQTALNSVAPISLTLAINDNGNTGGGSLSTSIIRTINVTPINDQPTLDAIADRGLISPSSGLQTVNLTGITAGGGESQVITVTATSNDQVLIPNSNISVMYTSPGNTASLQYAAAGGNGTAIITVTVSDNGGTANSGSDTVTRTFSAPVDSTAPAINISAPSVASTGGGPVTYTVTYSDSNFAGSSLNAGKITLNSTGNATGTVGVSGSGTSYTVTISSISGNGTLGISIVSGTAADTVENFSGAAGPSGTFSVQNNPSVINVSAPSAGTYRAGRNLDYSLLFNTSVFVDTSLGTPSVTLDIGGNTRNAVYLSGSESSTLVFRYVIQPGEIDSDGVGIISPIVLNGGTIRNSSNLDALLSFGPPEITGVRVDAVEPTVSGLTPPLNGSYRAGQNLDFTVSFDETVIVEICSGVPTINLLVGGDSFAAAYVSGSGTTALIFRYVVQASDTDSDGVTLVSPINLNGGVMTDNAGNPATLTLTATDTSNVLVDTTAPSVVSIDRFNPSTASTTDLVVTYRVTFSESVNNVTADDFTLVKTGTADGTILSVSGSSGTVFDVTVNSLDGSGTLGLDLNNFDTGILDVAGNAVPTGFHAGQVYSIVPSGDIVAVQTSNGTTEPFTGLAGAIASGTIGWDFTVGSSSMRVTKLGLFDLGGNGLLSSHPVGLWDSSGTLLASNTVQSGLSSSLKNGYRYESITPVILSPGQTYTLGALFPAGNSDGIIFGGSETYAPWFSYVGSRQNPFSPVAGFGRPNLNAGFATGIFGPNFQFQSGSSVVSVDPPPNASYRVGENLDFTVNYSENVTVSGGTPQLALTIGSTGVQAGYVSGSGTSALLFRHTVLAEENDGDGIAVGALTLNGATIQNSINLDAGLTFTTPNTSGVLVDTIAPTISLVQAPSSGTYIAGQSPTFQVTFSEGVTVDSTVGTPTIPLVIGSTTRAAGYGSGSGTTVLFFGYTIQADEVDADGITSGSPIALNLGTIRDAAGNNAVLSFAVPNTTGVRVDGKAPTILSVSPPPNGPYRAGQNLDFTFIFDEPVVVGSSGTPLINLSVGENTLTAAYVSGSGSSSLVFRHVVAVGETDSDGVVLSTIISLPDTSIKDAPGNSAVLTYTSPNTTGIMVDTTAPSIVSVAPPANQTYLEGEALNFTVTFSEPVVVGVNPTLSLLIGSDTRTATYVSGSGTTALQFRYVIPFGELDTDGITVIPTLGGVVTDPAGNNAVAVFLPLNTTGVRVDATAPVITSIAPAADGFYRAGENLDFLVTFNATVLVTGTPAIALTIGSPGKQATYVSGSGSTALLFRYSVQPGDTDNDGISLGSPLALNIGTIKNSLGTDATLVFTVPNTSGVIVDTASPTVGIFAPSTTFTRSGPITYTVTYTDSNFNASTLANANVSLNTTGTATGSLAVTGSGTTRTVTISGITGDGTVGISVAAGTATDRAGNLALAAGPSTTFTADNTGPTVTLSIPSVSNARSGPVTYTVTYADPLFDFNTLSVGDVTLNRTGTANGTVSVSGSGATATVTISAITGDGKLGISLAAGTGHDDIGNVSLAAGPSTIFTVDNTGPAVSISAPNASLTAGGPVTYTVTYADPLFASSSLAASDVTLNHTGTANGNLSVSGSGTTRTVTISGITGDGALGISLNAGTAQDTLGNLALSAGPSGTFNVDNTGPAVAISAPSGTIAASGPINYTVTYSDLNFDASTLVSGNITVNKTGNANASILVSGSGTTRTVSLTGITGDGTLGISIAAGTATDLAGNSAAAAGASATFTVDNTRPAVSISSPSASLTAAGPITYTVTYSDTHFNASTLSSGDITLNKTGTANGSVAVSGTGTTRLVTISGTTGNGTLGISVAAGTANDTAGNLAVAAGPSATFTVDNTPPNPPVIASISSHTGASASDHVTSDRTLIFSGTAENGAAVRLTRVGVGLIGTVSASGSGAWTVDYTGTILPEGTHTFTATATDAAGNTSASSASFSVTEDTSKPTLVISEPSVSRSKDGPVYYRVTYTGASTINLRGVDFTMNRTGTADGSASVAGIFGSVIVVMVSNLSGDGTLGISIAPGTAVDLAGNSADGAGPSPIFQVGNTAPTLVAEASIGLAGTDEDTASTAVLVSTLLTGSGLADYDPDDETGIAVTETSGRGRWQFMIATSNWVDFGGVSSTNALLLPASALVRYVPDFKNGETGNFTFRAWDQTTGVTSTATAVSYGDATGNGGFSAYSGTTANASIVVTSRNDAPTALATATLSGPIEDNSFSFSYQVIASAIGANDVDGDAISLVVIDVLSGSLLKNFAPVMPGTTTLLPGDSLLWTPDPELNGAGLEAFRISAADASTRSTNSTLVKVQVIDLNDPPHVVEDTITTDEDTPISFTAASLLANDAPGPVDELGQTMTITWIYSPTRFGGTVEFDEASGVFHYTPPANFNGTDVFHYIVTDNGKSFGIPDARWSEATLSIKVNPVNDAPILVADAFHDYMVEEGSELTTTFNVVDVEGEGLKFSLGAGAPAGAVIDPETGVFRWTPSEAQGPASYSILVVATTPSGSASSKAFQVFVTEKNTPPALALISDRTITDVEELLVTAAAIDADQPGNGLSFSLAAGAPAGAVIDPVSGKLSWKPGLVVVPQTVSFTVRVDDHGAPNLSDTRSFNVTVNPALRITEEPLDVTRPLGGTATFTVAAVGLPPVTYQWLRHGAPLAGATNATLVIPNLRGTNTDDYAVVVRSQGQQVTSRAAKLTVGTEPPLSVVSIGLVAGTSTPRVTLAGPLGGTYGVYQSTNLKTWQLLAPVTMNAATIEFTDDAGTGVPARFYRLGTLP